MVKKLMRKHVRMYTIYEGKSGQRNITSNDNNNDLKKKNVNFYGPLTKPQ